MRHESRRKKMRKKGDAAIMRKETIIAKGREGRKER